ncbi:LysR family transcriptional regulator [Ensifer adhaerens]|nr:LysR family transcriptional regulator [Ensifer adhaerens]MBZ7927758.1 LysR family transcriptional regulator [Ensifer adhaerens]UAX97598.1 LysR family transcriptional regulator [Ensifer adhaerens]UAY05011.1 LysR family transcriptional regulator [Ensifer adhaerens]UAY12431.1 LysR family transcriptional regulator [Ensifer adhaerens]
MDLDGLKDFNLVALHGSFGRASRVTGRSKATLSRRVSDLEASLGVRLIERGSRGLRLTEEGSQLHERTLQLLSEIEEIAGGLSTGHAQPRGHLRVTAPILFSHTHLPAVATAFTKRYPAVSLEISAEDRFVDLVQEGFDIAIRVNPRPDDALVGRCFARDEMLITGTPEYLRTFKEGGERVRLPSVEMSLAQTPAPWLVNCDDKVRLIEPDVRLRLSSLLMVRDAACEGAGVAILPRLIVTDDLSAGRLAVLGTLPDSAVEYWALHLSRRYVSPKVSRFLAALNETFASGTLPDLRTG